jgi:hypothetical protein
LAVDGNVLNAAGTAAYLALANQLILPVVVAGNSWQLGISTRPAPPATLVSRHIPVNLITIDPTFGTVVRRKPGRGI